MKSCDFVVYKKEPLSDFFITATVKRRGLVFSLNYKISGEVENLLFPHPAKNGPGRTAGIWETTCFEFFVRNRESPEYLEFNFSPNGNWNAFKFKTYRKNMVEYNALKQIDITLKEVKNTISLQIELELIDTDDNFGIEDFKSDQMRFGICAVIENTANIVTYWAPSHPEKKPDFHSEDSMNIKF